MGVINSVSLNRNKVVIWTIFRLKLTKGEVFSHLQDQVQRGLLT